MRMFAIMNTKNNNNFWSNDAGWVNTPTHSLYTEKEKESLTLPINGEWVYMCGGQS